jgi:DNA-binding MarR family transcriptional regulator
MRFNHEKRDSSSGESSRIRKMIAICIFMGSLLMFSSLIIPDANAAHTYHRDVAAMDHLMVDVQTEYLNIESGHELPLVIRVTHGGLPVSGASVEIIPNIDCCTFRFDNETTDESGQVVAYMIGTAREDVVSVDIAVIARSDEYSSSPPVYIRDIAIEPVVQILDKEDIIYVGIGGLLAIAVLGATEFGKYGLIKLIFLPLYSRVRKEDVLDHFVRGQIYGYIMSHPGEHYNGIKQALKVNNGTLSHHLKTLEMQGYLKSQRDGTYKRFYPVGTKIPRSKGIQMSDLQIEIVDAIRQIPGITQKEIAKREGITQQSVSYNLRILVRFGVLRCVRNGVRKKYFIVEES